MKFLVIGKSQFLHVVLNPEGSHFNLWGKSKYMVFKPSASITTAMTSCLKINVYISTIYDRNLSLYYSK